MSKSRQSNNTNAQLANKQIEAIDAAVEKIKQVVANGLTPFLTKGEIPELHGMIDGVMESVKDFNPSQSNPADIKSSINMSFDSMKRHVDKNKKLKNHHKQFLTFYLNYIQALAICRLNATMLLYTAPNQTAVLTDDQSRKLAADIQALPLLLAMVNDTGDIDRAHEALQQALARADDELLYDDRIVDGRVEVTNNLASRARALKKQCLNIESKLKSSALFTTRLKQPDELTTLADVKAEIDKISKQQQQYDAMQSDLDGIKANAAAEKKQARKIVESIDAEYSKLTANIKAHNRSVKGVNADTKRLMGDINALINHLRKQLNPLDDTYLQATNTLGYSSTTNTSRANKECNVFTQAVTPSSLFKRKPTTEQVAAINAIAAEMNALAQALHANRQQCDTLTLEQQLKAFIQLKDKLLAQQNQIPHQFNTPHRPDLSPCAEDIDGLNATITTVERTLGKHQAELNDRLAALRDRQAALLREQQTSEVATEEPHHEDVPSVYHPPVPTKSRWQRFTDGVSGFMKRHPIASGIMIGVGIGIAVTGIAALTLLIPPVGAAVAGIAIVGTVTAAITVPGAIAAGIGAGAVIGATSGAIAGTVTSNVTRRRQRRARKPRRPAQTRERKALLADDESAARPTNSRAAPAAANAVSSPTTSPNVARPSTSSSSYPPRVYVYEDGSPADINNSDLPKIREIIKKLNAQPFFKKTERTNGQIKMLKTLISDMYKGTTLDPTLVKVYRELSGQQQATSKASISRHHRRR